LFYIFHYKNNSENSGRRKIDQLCYKNEDQYVEQNKQRHLPTPHFISPIEVQHKSIESPYKITAEKMPTAEITPQSYINNRIEQLNQLLCSIKSKLNQTKYIFNINDYITTLINRTNLINKIYLQSINEDDDLFILNKNFIYNNQNENRIDELYNLLYKKYLQIK